MGDMADWTIECMLEDEDENEDYLLDIFPTKGDPWIDKSGKAWNLKDMSESHIKNCHAFLQRRINQPGMYRDLDKESYFLAWQKLLEAELIRRKREK